MAGWSALPYDLIESIANLLNAAEDFLSFSSVCRSWRLVYKSKNWHPGFQLPWLMLGEMQTNKGSMRQFLSMCKFKFHYLPFPETQDFRCWGACQELVITINPRFEVRLVNPFTHACIDLPSITTLNIQGAARDCWFSFIHKAKYFKIQNEYMVFIIYGPRFEVAFTRSGDSIWSLVQSLIPARFVDVVCFKDQIMALSIVGTLFSLETNGVDPPRMLCVSPPPQQEKSWQKMYLVESSGDLLILFSYPSGNMVSRFRAYRFDISKREWIRLEDLGNNVLLIDTGICTSLLACDYLQCNCIYFVHDNLDSFLASGPKCMGNYMSVYNLKENYTDFMNFGNDNSFRYISPTWVLPSLW